MATLTRPSESKTANNIISGLNESTNDELASTVPAPFPQLQRAEVPLQSTAPPHQGLNQRESESTNQRSTEPQTHPESHPEIEIEEVKVDSVSHNHFSC